MSDRVETGVYTRFAPWFGLRDSITVHEDRSTLTVAEAKKHFPHSYQQAPALAEVVTPDGKTIYVPDPRKSMIVRHDPRTDEYRVVGTNSDRYSMATVDETFDFAEGILSPGKNDPDYGDNFGIETAALLCEGRKFMTVVNLGEAKLSGLDETIQWYIMLVNSFDGSLAFGAHVTTIRAECHNMMSAALATAERSWSIRHRTNLMDRIEDAKTALGTAVRYKNEYKKFAEKLLSTKVSQAKFSEIMDNLYPFPENVDSRAYRETESVRDIVSDILNGTTVSDHPMVLARTDNLANVKGTAWGVWNAVGEYSDWGRRVNGKDGLTDDENAVVKAEALAERQLFDTALKDKALKVIVDTMGIKVKELVAA